MRRTPRSRLSPTNGTMPIRAKRRPIPRRGPASSSSGPRSDESTAFTGTEICFALARRSRRSTRYPDLSLLRRELGRRGQARWDVAQRGAVRFFRGGVAGLMILGIAVYFPEIVKLRVSQDILGAQHRGHHGVVLVVVFVHPVAADEMQIWITRLQLLADRLDVRRVVVVVNRIRFLLANDSPVQDIAMFRETDLKQLAFGLREQVFVLRVPNAVVFEAEIFQAVTSLVVIRHHLGRPGTEVLDPADLHIWIVDINPVVVKGVAVLDDQHHGEEVAILQRIRRRFRRLRNSRPNPADQLAHWRG